MNYQFWLLLALFIMISVLFITMAVITVRTIAMKVFWKYTDAVIESISISYGKDEGNITFNPDVKYKYVVDGKSYFGDRVYYPNVNDLALKYLKKDGLANLKKGSNTKIFYNLKKPHQSTIIICGFVELIIVTAILFLLTLALGFMLLYVAANL